MINEKEGFAIVTDDAGNQIKVQVIFGFEVEEYNKNYIVYTTESDSSSDEINVMISEFDKKTYEIKSIPEDEMNTVMEFYNNAKNIILNEN